MTWWSWREVYTRSHPELGRENSQRRWYSVSRRGRVGRRQVFTVQTGSKSIRHNSAKQNRLAGTAGWSSPVARQAHNLKVVGSNPTPATKPSSPTIITHALTRQPVRRLRRFATVASPRQ